MKTKQKQWGKILAVFVTFGVSLFAAPVSYADLNTGLIAYWSFDETGGSVAHDAVNSVNGTLQGGATFVQEGIQGGAIKLDIATGDFVDMGNNFAFDSGSYSIQAWVKLNAGDTSVTIPVARHWEGRLNGYLLSVNDISDGCSVEGKALFYTSAQCSGVSSIKVNDGQWHQLVGIYDTTSQKVSLYVDGQFQSSLGFNGNSAIGNATSFRVGGIEGIDGNSVRSTYTGLIDEVRLYNKALSATIIKQLYLQGFPPHISGTATWQTSHTITCQNITQNKSVVIPKTKVSAWDCEKAGLPVNHGDKVKVTIDGAKY